MRRFLFGLLSAALLWWGYTALFADDAAAGVPGGTPADLSMLANPNAPAEGAAPGPDGGAQTEGTQPGSANAKVAERPLQIDAGATEGLASRVRSGEPEAVAEAWGSLAGDATDGDRQLLRQALAEAAPGDAATAVARLGSNNAFLHSDEGRAAARAALKLVAEEEEDPVAVGLLTRMVESCMRGRIRPDQTKAQALVDEIYGELRKPVLRHVCNPADLTRARSYTVRSGDSLSRIANRFRRDHSLNLDSGTLAVLNRIHNPNALQVGQVLKVPTDPIVTVLEKRSFLMAVYVGDVILRLYWVGHGVDSKTPEVEFTVSEKLERPDWYSPDGVFPYGHPKNILGNYFVKFRHASLQGFGAHGTPDPETIGTEASAGCIRMTDEDIKEYFGIVPRGSKVVIRANR